MASVRIPGRRAPTIVGTAILMALALGACGSDGAEAGSPSPTGATTSIADGVDPSVDGDREPPPLVEVDPDAAPTSEGSGDAGGGDGRNDGDGGSTEGDPADGDDEFVVPPSVDAEGNPDDQGPTAQEIIEELLDDPTTEVGGEVPETPEVVEPLDIDVPCDLFTPSELGELMVTWSERAGLLDELPAGLLADGAPVAFAVETNEESSCNWFSDPQIWLASVDWQASEPSFSAIVLSKGTAIDGVGEQAALLSDSQAVAVVEGLLVTVTNLPPGATSTNRDARVTQLLLTEVVNRIESAA
ncbi:MAG: hypothetical protein OEW42_19105 [Acidimicrobiia bacterium]|nr:hypothetical protein [Acidimicrobiia bacterium]